ncbi:hypothetical protein [Rhodobacter capsulatus]|jgi:hypothetical protein|uniref:Uncharacterized protein n=2 Tax=Rhodobacter capsulatus TaxID=1061 RepID=D5AUU3_RHOCB|nr:hypothetical protein [Rhodobacter capsulatus]AAC16223.1 hypothetical protein [Rhodobacter capsulatus SB 1003]ADE85732.1 conserved hypothetical protein [Rhodobacter capsulatus SB 1003]ETD01873.1 hypothetical protein U714_11270 [Rhodobacter capsulatus DE442]ETD76930.1 hypothetical protein U717_11425 [Rhodobacter capsulatus R121]ETE53766.1 hypothetical protein U715_11430 [Rhodobacter capsulatus Y262]
MARLVTVRFLRGSAPYNTGEIAGFEAQVARALIASGAAEAVKAAPLAPDPAAGAGTRQRVVLTFLAAAPPYHAGDVAGFDPLEAAALVARGKAVPLTTRTGAGEEPGEDEACDTEEPGDNPAADPGDDPGADCPDDGIDDDAAEPDFLLVDHDDDGNDHDHDDDGAAEDLDDDGEDGAPPVQGRAG